MKRKRRIYIIVFDECANQDGLQEGLTPYRADDGLLYNPILLAECHSLENGISILSDEFEREYKRE